MEYIDMGKDVRFSRIIQGFWRLTDWNMSQGELVEFLKKCFELGVTTLDTAMIYGDGECERQLGNALKEFKRSEYQIVTKCGIYTEKSDDFGYYDTSYDAIITSCKESLEKLGCGYIEVFLIHREDPMINHHEVARALNDLKKQGLIKEAGVSNFDPFKFNALNKAIGGTLCTNQIELNPCCFEHFNSGMIDLLQGEKIKPMIWSPLAGGKIFDSSDKLYAKTYEVCELLAKKYNTTVSTLIYAWLLKHPVCSMPIVGSSKIERLKEAVDALEIKLEVQDWYRIYSASGQQEIR